MPVLLAGLLLAAVPGARADTSSSSLDVTVSGTITEPTCTVNNNNAVSVEFGTVDITNLSHAEADVPVTIDCAGSLPSGGVKLAINGNTTTFHTTALSTNVSGLGVVIMPPAGASHGQTELEPGTYYDVTTLGMAATTGTVNLKAGLVADGSTTLSGGEFTASATLVLQMV